MALHTNLDILHTTFTVGTISHRSTSCRSCIALCAIRMIGTKVLGKDTHSACSLCEYDVFEINYLRTKNLINISITFTFIFYLFQLIVIFAGARRFGGRPIYCSMNMNF